MKGKVVLVTGGTGGIGTAICRKFADKGAFVIATYARSEKNKHRNARNWQEMQRKDGYEFNVASIEVTDYESCRMVVASVERRLGPVDILVNAAGITRDSQFVKMEPTAWKEVLDTNLLSVFNVTHQVIAGMIERKFGRIVNISSINGEKGQFGQTNYAAAKAGMHGFTMSLAQEVAGKGVTVNTVSPGYVGTSMVMSIREDVRQKIIDQIPVRRLAMPEEIAAAIVFLADETSGFITGSNLSINGGQYMS